MAVYAPAIDAPFTFDDYPNIVSYAGAQPDTLSELVDSARHPTRQDRPIARLTLGLNYLVSGLDPTAYHVTNIAIHAVASIVLLLLLLALCRAPRSPDMLARNALAFAALAALLWAVHPVNTQAVSYIVQRMASLAGLFYLATLYVFVRWRLGEWRTPVAVPLALALFALALGSKMSAASVPAACWVLEVAFFSGLTRRNLDIGGVVVAVGLAGGAWAMWPHLQYLFIEHPRLGFTGIERLLTECRVLWHYVSLLLWPDAGRLQVDYAYTASAGLFRPPSTAVGLLGIVAATGLAVVGLRRGRLIWPAAGWLLFLVGSSVEASPVMLDPIFEQRIYLPGALLLPGLIAPLFTLTLSPRAWTTFRLGALAVIAGVALQTVERNRQWASPATLWAADLAQAKPMRAAANSTVGALAKLQSGQVLEVLRRANRIAESDEGLIRLLRSARAYMVQGKFDRAREYTSRALERAPRSRRAAYLHALNLMETGDVDPAETLVRQLAEQRPDSVMALQLEAALAMARGRPAQAVERIRRWLDQHPDAPLPARNTARVQLAIATERAGDPGAAARIYRQVIRTNPQNWTAWRNLAQLYRAGGSSEEANRILRYLEARGVRVGGTTSAE